MEAKTEIKLEKNHLKIILLIIIIPFFLTFILEHFGKFNYSGAGGVSYADVRVSDIKFTSLFGSIIEGDARGKDIGYEVNRKGTLVISPPYLVRLPYFIKGFIKDILYPIILVVALLVLYFFNKKYSIKLS